ncbi:MAG: EutN/CcmL family microcompartment protein [Planctomycetota bacterium]|jgi:microcompartment protein CcmK/EutM
MIIARVIGTVWATRKEPSLEGLKLLIVERTGLDLKPKGGVLIAVDACEAGVGEVVIVSQGSAARQTEGTHNRPVDAVVMAIVDNLEVADTAALDKSYQARRTALAAELALQPEL